MTFIRKLVEDMQVELGAYSEIKTFHAYCKKILHERDGQVELIPYLTKVVKKDAELLEKHLEDFDTKFRMLDENSAEVAFYLSRGDHYEVVSFDDSVYRLYKFLEEDLSILPSFDQIVIDEFQDFNPLEVAFISKLEKKGPILIVGDDDQAIYNDRSASPKYLRYKHNSGEFTIFELPFCSRCTEVVVSAVNTIIDVARASGFLKERISKRYECYLEAKENDSIRYPKIVTAQCTTVAVIPKYICNVISKIPQEDIAESRRDGNEYPTVLIIGPRQYLRKIDMELSKIYPHLSYSPSTETEYGIIEAYEQILRDEKSNLGWRILMELFCELEEQKEILSLTEDGTAAMVDLLDPDFISAHLRVVEIIKSIQSGNNDVDGFITELEQIVGGDYLNQVIKHFTSDEASKDLAIDKALPTILLTSYKGCKGLSAGYVFVVGANNGSMPKDPDHVEDVEISQFIVALTRTRKQCHVVSNKWLFSPKTPNKKWTKPFEKSSFISWIPPELIEDRGTIKSENFK